MPEIVGRVEGSQIAVSGPSKSESTGGSSYTVLLSGSEVIVRGGTAHITLSGGGEIEICGAAKFTLLKSGGAVTLALHHGRLRARLKPEEALRIFTALVVAVPLGVGDGPRDAIFGLDEGGTLCILTYRGAARLEQQLTGQTLVVPESSELQLPSGQLDAMREARSACRCDGATVVSRSIQIGAGVPAGQRAAAKPEEKPGERNEVSPPVPREEPVWKVLMPPLTFNAGQPPPPDPSPEMIVFVREARVVSAVTLTGRVEPHKKADRAPKTAKVKGGRAEEPGTRTAGAPVAPPAPAADSAESTPVAARGRAESGSGFGSKVRGFFRRLFGGRSKTQT